MRRIWLGTSLLAVLQVAPACKREASPAPAAATGDSLRVVGRVGANDETSAASDATGAASDETGAPGDESGAALRDRATQLRRDLPDSFTVVVEPPFVIVGDGEPDSVRAAAAGTVRWAVTRLKRAYFARDPERLLTIWLFKDAASYERYNVDLFGTAPTTPFGFYSSEHEALVMNIATGGGTLVHELVHPYIEANFDTCPAWFNEGLGSLYEQSADREGHIIGLTNWRLAGLQTAINEGNLPSLERLTSTTTQEFYFDDPGTNYAQARYLLYYLQERGLLRSYYRAFVAAAGTDPSGYQTLQLVLGERDMSGFEQRWKAFVLGLHFP